MKKLNTLLIVLSFVLMSRFIFAQPEELKGSLTLSGAWAIYPTAVAWAEAFQKIHPKVKIDISAGGAGKGAADAIAGLVDIGMVSREPDPAEINKGISVVYILKDAVYPVISEKNFYSQELLTKGISRQTFRGIYIDGTIKTWDAVTGQKGNKPVHIYTRSDSCGAAASWAEFFGKKQEDLKGIGIFGDPGLLEAVRRDPVGIGYNNFSFVFGRDGSLLPGIKLVPIDANENGKADADEIFSNRAEAVTAIEAGRYPATRKNYFFVRKQAGALVKEFIKFALSTEGSRIVDEVATSLAISTNEQKESLKTLESVQ